MATLDKDDVARLVMQAQAGSNEAFSQLAVCFEKTVFRIAFGRLHNFLDAEEVAQEVFLCAFRKLHQLQDPWCFPGWIKKMTERLATNRKIRGRHAYSRSLRGLVSKEEDPLDSLLRVELLETISRAIGHLRDLDQQTIRAFYLEGLTLKEMRQRFSAPIGTIKRRLHDARDRLRQKLRLYVF